MKTFLPLDPNYSRTVSVRLPRSIWLAIEALRQQFAIRDLVPHTFSAVLVFLLETYLYEHQHIDSAPVLKGQVARRLARAQLQKENAALRQQLAEALKQNYEVNP